VSVRIVTDSAASLPSGEAWRLGIVVVPFNLVIDGVPYLDGELAPAELAARSSSAALSTSAPSPGDFAKDIEDHDVGDGTVVITVASTMSASFQSALVARRYLAGSAIHVVDSGTAAGAQGLVVLAAAQRAAAGAGIDDVAAAAREAASKVRLVAAVERLDFLAASGRVPAAAARAGNTLRVRPLFEFCAGEARPLRPAFSMKAALDRIADSLGRQAAIPGALRVAVLHAQATADADRLLGRILAVHPGADVFVAPFSTVMTAHTGPGVVGAAWWHDRPATSVADHCNPTQRADRG
jgi:DegV family protein with EDD domain